MADSYAERRCDAHALHGSRLIAVCSGTFGREIKGRL